MSMSAAYHTTNGKAEINDAATGTKINQQKIMLGAIKDPTQPLRDRIAARIADHVKDVACPTCVDVGCSIGNDCATLLAALDREAKVMGVDVMEAQLEQARERVPGAVFVQGEAVKLPLGDASVDSLQCARLLIHTPDLRAVVDEFVRVMKPGAIGVFYEGDYRTQKLLTTDAALAKVYSATQSFTFSGIAHPNVAQEVFKCLLATPDVEDVTIDGFPICSRDPTYGFPGMLEIEKARAQKVVEMGELTQEELDGYYSKLGAAIDSGDWIESGMLFEIGFVKKGIGVSPAAA